jgi:SNF2 family DNA or RNA helicase
VPPKAKRKSLEPWLLDSIEFYQHQVDGVRELARRRSFILADDMGLGKSLEALTVFAVDVVRGFAETAIVIAPPTLKGNWADEIKKFTRFPYFILDSTDNFERTKTLARYMIQSGPKILIVGYEQAGIHGYELEGLRFDVAIYDEAHYIKSPMSKRTKAVLGIRSRRSFMLTGTPLENRVDEIWCLLHRVDPERYGNYYGFINRHAKFGGFNGRQITGVQNERELIKKVQEVMLRRLKKDVLDLPEVQIIPRKVDLYDEQWKMYQEIAEDLVVNWDTDENDESEPLEWAFVKTLRLRQLCGSMNMFTGEDISAKLDLAIEDDRALLENGEKIVVFTQFRHVLDAYQERAVDLGVPTFTLSGDVPIADRVPTVKRWSDVTGPAMILNMQQVANYGLNMTAARQVSFLDFHYNPQKNQQGIDRCNRIGQDKTQPVQVRQYICRKTVEVRVAQLNAQKQKLFDLVINSNSTAWKKKLRAMLMEEEGDD